MRKFPIYLLLEIHFLDTPRCSIGAINHLHRGEVSTHFPHGLWSDTDLLVLLRVPLTVLLADGGPADGAHVVDAAPLVPGHHQPRHGEPGELAPPGQQHPALLVMVARLKTWQARVWV